MAHEHADPQGAGTPEPPDQLGQPDQPDRLAGEGAVNYVPVRRRPELMRFLWVGGLLGLFLGFVVSLIGPDAMDSSALQEGILIGGIGLLIGGFLAAILYLIADHLSMRS